LGIQSGLGRDFMEIAKRPIGTYLSPYVVIEIGAGWRKADPEGSIIELMTAAKDAGADAVKIQLYKPEDLVLKESPSLTSGLWAGQPLWDLYEQGSLPEEIVPNLFKSAATMGITLFASVFSKRVVPLLESCQCPAYKIASAEVSHRQLLWAVEATRKPVIISTGGARIDEVRQARHTFGHDDVALLHCIPAYPAEAEHMDLLRLKRLQHYFDPELVGLSDHSRSSIAAIAAVAMGASIIEKHVAFPMTPDAGFAMRAYELPDFVSSIRDAWDACHAEMEPIPPEFARSIWAIKDIAEGEKFTLDNIAVLRPAGGMHPLALSDLISSKAARAFKKGEPVPPSE
jgi:pseudaminic acid synthase